MKKPHLIFIKTAKFLGISILLFSCSGANQLHKSEKIKSISISTFGGERGYFQSLVITPDTLYYELGSSVDTANNKSIKKINSRYKFEDIISENQINGFSTITNGKSLLPVDGTDTEITIKTDSSDFKVRNAEHSRKWLTVQAKMNTILEKEFK
ncbi:hypothetical protein LPB86_11595 [Pedobacter sp. MC2016-14]|uniref:hypothetical protein n=1 Tax=Pedobacter sp. MC2016-14 TaxID=2897327 RepID=UPI001E2C44A5|nr:hypothetical protein [Pedobacter sp. MC2016-14]MCD0488877.1 hypothetical protein [Pedobacter sp. MC2016-14]